MSLKKRNMDKAKSNILDNFLWNTRNFGFYSSTIFKRKVSSISFLGLLLGFAVIILGMAAIFEFVLNNVAVNSENNFNEILRLVQSVLPYSYTFQASIAVIFSAALFIVIGFISSDINEKKVTRNMELIVSAIKPKTTLKATIVAYLLVLVLIGCWLSLIIYISKRFIGNYFFDEIGLLPHNMSVREWIEGVGLFTQSSANGFIPPANSISSSLSWNGDANIPGGTGYGYFSITDGVISFSSLTEFYGVNLSSYYSMGVDIVIIGAFHFLFSLLTFCLVVCGIASIFSSTQELAYGLAPVVLLASLPLIVFPIIFTNTGGSASTEDVTNAPEWVRILSYIPGVNASILTTFLVDSSSITGKAFILLADGIGLILIYFIVSIFYPYAVLNYSNDNIFKQIKSVFSNVFSFKSFGGKTNYHDSNSNNDVLVQGKSNKHSDEPRRSNLY